MDMDRKCSLDAQIIVKIINMKNFQIWKIHFVQYIMYIIIFKLKKKHTLKSLFYYDFSRTNNNYKLFFCV